jgi:hypothetical protein
MTVTKINRKTGTETSVETGLSAEKAEPGRCLRGAVINGKAGSKAREARPAFPDPA